MLCLHPLDGGERQQLGLLGSRLAFEVVGRGPYCTGRFVFGSLHGGGRVPCPGRALAVTGGQCERCAATDGFRFLHQVHRGGSVSGPLGAYVAQPHWLYIATFADATSKVGTAAQLRKRVRLHEQGALRATYVARAADGRLVRRWEDDLSQAIGLSQTKRGSAKVRALVGPRSGREIERAHQEQVRRAAPVLVRLGADVLAERWHPPAVHLDFWQGEAAGGSPEYPHPLTEGPHCLSVHAMIGAAALATVNDAPRFVIADLGALKGRRILRTDVRSPPVVAQDSLF